MNSIKHRTVVEPVTIVGFVSARTRRRHDERIGFKNIQRTSGHTRVPSAKEPTGGYAKTCDQRSIRRIASASRSFSSSSLRSENAPGSPVSTRAIGLPYA